MSAASAGLVVIVVMGLISGLAAACFAKAFGIVFLGAPRTAAAETAHEAAPTDAGGNGGAGAALRRDRIGGAGSGRVRCERAGGDDPAIVRDGAAPSSRR